MSESIRVPITYEKLLQFIEIQEKILNKPIIGEKQLRKRLVKNGIVISDDKLNHFLNKINHEMRRKYRVEWFTRQSKFQVVEQILKLEQEKSKEKIQHLVAVNDMLSVFNNGIQDIIERDDEDEHGNDNVFVNGMVEKRKEMIQLVQEIPDSNLLVTNNVELIEDYDNIKEILQEKTNKLKKMKNKLKKLKRLKMEVGRLKNEDGLQKALRTDENREEVNAEVAKMRYYLSMISSKLNEDNNIKKVKDKLGQTIGH